MSGARIDSCVLFVCFGATVSCLLLNLLVGRKQLTSVRLVRASLVSCVVVSLLSSAKQVNAALAEISVIHNKIFLESFWADLDEVMQLKDCEVRQIQSTRVYDRCR